MGPPAIFQAPFIGEHSRRFCTGDLGMDPAQVDATPKGSIAPVADFQVRAVEDPNQHEVEISWTEVAGYRTEIWTFPVAKRSQLSALSTPDHFAAAGGRRIQPLPGGSERGGGVTRRYAIDERKARAELGYVPAVDFKGGMERTIAWYLANEDWWRPLLAR